MYEEEKQQEGGEDLVKQQRKWDRELSSSHKYLQDWHKRAEKIYETYIDKRSDDSKRTSKTNLFNANTKLLANALFARKPKPEVVRTSKDPSDQVARVACSILQRALVSEIENDPHAESVFEGVIKDFILPGAGVAWVRYVTKEEDVQISGRQDDELAEFDDAGPIITDETTPIEHVTWKDVRWSPARKWEEVRWVARRAFMDKDSFKERFGDEHIEEHFSKKDNEEGETDAAGVKNSSVNTVGVWEIWCKTSKKVYFIVEGATTALDIKDDPFNLPHFFPTTHPLFEETEDQTLVPIPAYTLVQGQYEELNTLNSRISNLVRACKVLGTYDQSSKELAQLLNSNTAETSFVPVQDFSKFASGGGMRSAMSFLPTEEYAKTIQLLRSEAEAKKQQIYELTGISDIVRGVTNQYETAAAQGIKAQFASQRLQVTQNKVARYFASLIRIKAFLMVKFYDPERLLEKAGTLPEKDLQYVPQALALLKNELLSQTNIEVSVDSLQLADWQQDKQELNEAIAALSAFVRESMPMVERKPELGPMFFHVIKAQMARYRGMRELEGFLEEQLEQLLVPQQQQPKPPDPAVVQAQQQMQAKQAELQANMQLEQGKAQMQAQQHQAELALKAKVAESNATIEVQKIELEKAKLRIEELKLANAGIDTSDLNLPMGDGTQSQRLTKEELLMAMQSMQQQNAQMMQQMMQGFMAAMTELVNTPAPPAEVIVRRDPTTGTLSGTIQ